MQTTREWSNSRPNLMEAQEVTVLKPDPTTANGYTPTPDLGATVTGSVVDSDDVVVIDEFAMPHVDDDQTGRYVAVQGGVLDKRKRHDFVVEIEYSDGTAPARHSEPLIVKE